MNNIEINIHQHNPDCLVYYTIKVGEWVYDGDARNVPSALKMIQHNLKWDYRDYENELEKLEEKHIPINIHDAIENYFNCITTCSLNDNTCITECVNILKS